VWDQSELLLQCTDNLASNPVQWTTVTQYAPSVEEVGMPFRYEQSLLAGKAFYRVRTMH